ncbi:molybdopterin converting factor subunit 1 [Pseudomonas fluorescens]|jgi:molybdopterin synthase sulfur carrier subunit|uniref:Molybdopterin synthase sulfur carrier subunit n=1 Tax=Pseudomonas fluorescens TaxID=294 RepID=A0A2N1EGC4_PSEFL|nr:MULTISPECIES: molybdopterin converting factor subunit 1 [Pseudomonas]AIB40526.1 molybdenum cofactor biosynthesis protein MoaD [Pseudomonas sp. WCS374]AOS72512.1 molybdopterin converting factor subunit 1 [Pseudomonas fluorescens]MBD8096039.1 molybdopterin converting factor subunit 1 [Pseudomonas fluorescens]MBD8772468.1 molybdopterin converting factor subunit 1 [Pseudomonas fluorescens]MBD8778992.1 molybdopterin converting factor subunit 1 [Pseudomonas fluorescens]
MSINVLFFARYAEAVGFDSLEMEGEFATVDAVRLALAADPEFAVLNEASLMCARNEELCNLDEPVQAGDEVAFFPPVTGG